jgi:hypothetical protein
MRLFLLTIAVQLLLDGMLVNIRQRFIVQLQVLFVSIIQQIHAIPAT